MTAVQSRVFWGILVPLAVGTLIALWLAPKAHACDPTFYYDPLHGVCQAFPPANSGSPGYLQQPSNYPYPTSYPNAPQYGGGN